MRPDQRSTEYTFPLSGVTVVEVGDGRGEMCARFLADMGAKVIMVEPPQGRPTRYKQPLYEGRSLHFASHNANKRSIVLDLNSRAGKKDLMLLAAHADILIESYQPGYLASLDIRVDALRVQKPALVMLSLTDFGQTGPYRDYRASSSVHTAMGGVLARSGIEGNAPIQPPGELAAETTAIQAAWALLLAYWQRLQTGRGNYLDFSIYEATAQVVDPGLGVTGSAAVGRTARELSPYGRPPVSNVYPIFKCADGYVRICVLNPRQWQGMCTWLGDDHEFTDPMYGNIAKRFAVVDEINLLIANLFSKQTMADLVREGQSRVVPIAAVATPSQVLADEHFNARGAFTEFGLGDIKGKLPSGYFELDGKRMGLRQDAPQLGEHQHELEELRLQPAQAAQDTALTSRRPFEGLRILDLGVIVAGAETGRLFADQGAEVIKLENSAFPDGLRQSSAGTLISQSFCQGSRNKLSMGLNLRSEEGIKLFYELVKETDVVLSNFKPGTLESLGIGYEQLKAVNPRVIVSESSALGNTGPSAKTMGYGPLVRASSGLTGLWSYPNKDGAYCDATTIFPDHFAARVTTSAILAALIRREKTGVGGNVVVSQAEVILNTMATQFLRESLAPGAFKPMGNAYEFDAPGNLFPCKGDDVWCVVEVRSDDDWSKLCGVIDRQDLLDNPSYSTAVGRVQHRDVLEAALREWTTQRSQHEVMSMLQAAGVIAGNMQRLSEFDDNEHFLARKFFRHFDQPGFPGSLQTENGPVSFSELPDPVINPAPFKGQHTEALARRLLGCTDEQIEALVAKGVLEPMAPNEFISAS